MCTNTAGDTVALRDRPPEAQTEDTCYRLLSYRHVHVQTTVHVTDLYTRSICTCILVYTHRAKWVKVGGILYKTPCALLLRIVDDYPQFGNLTDVYVLNSTRVVFNVCVMETVTFLSHYNAYCVTPSPIHRVVPLSNLHSPFPVHIHHIVISDITKLVVVPKYHVSGCLY